MGSDMTISLAEYHDRRMRLAALLEDNSACFIYGSGLKTRSNDTEYPFRPNSNLWYLTGFHEPDAALCLIKKAEQLHTILFCNAKDTTAEIWHGRRVGVESAPLRYGLDEAIENTHMASTLARVCSGLNTVYVDLADNEAHTIIIRALDTVRNTPKQSFLAPQHIHDLAPHLHACRVRKSATELGIMRRAGELSADAHKMAMRASRPGLNERHLEAVLHYHFALAGAREPAYNSIVGSSENACILHYTENNCALGAGDLVLIDAGAELHGYAADITRTFPVDGTFTSEQAALYDIVLASQEAAIQACRAGVTFTELLAESVEVLVAGLCDLGILTGSVADNIEHTTYRQYFMHGIGHYLGLDVHDVGAYKDSYGDIPLPKNAVITIEPGLYIASGSPCDEKYHGIGIRIEDNVVVQEQGCEILTAGVPKTRAAIEALMREDYIHTL